MQKEGLGKRLKEFRETLDLSQHELGKKINCSQSKVYKIENELNDLNSIDADALHALGVDLNWLIADDGHMFHKNKQLKNLEEIKKEYNLTDEHLLLIQQLLIQPDLREILIRFVKNLEV